MRDVVNFLGFDVIMFLRAAARRQMRLREALMANGRIAMRQQLADFRAVLGDERRDFPKILNFHRF